MRRLLATLSLLALLGACDDPIRPPEPDRAAIAAAAREIAAAPPPRAAPRGTEEDLAMLRRVAERTARAAQPFCEAELRRRCDFQVALVESRQANAFASGRDRITFTTALMRLLSGEDEVAAIMAHEMAHHIAGHIGETTWRMRIGAWLGWAAGALLGEAATQAIGFDPGLSRMGAQAGARLGDLSYSKAQEREADWLGAWITARAGYDLGRAAGIWAKLTHLSGDQTTSLLDSHPAGPERLALWRRAAEEIARDPARGPRG
jgi:predicted Zn-dependent protease